MPMEANAASAAGSLQPIQRPTNANQTDSPRRIESAVESPFAKETNVTIRNSVADLSAVLERISSAQEDAVEAMPQDLQKVFPNAVKKGADGFLTIRMEDMFFAVINAIKELDTKYQAQEKRIDALEKRIQKLEAKTK